MLAVQISYIDINEHGNGDRCTCMAFTRII